MAVQPRTITQAAICALALALCAAPATAALYKWTDASGRVVYSDQPPPGNVKVETLQGPPPVANPNAVKDLANKEMEFKQRQLEKIETDGMPFDPEYPPKKGRWSKRSTGSERWVLPTTVCEATFAEWTRDGHIRHPSFKGMRRDKPASAVRREA